MISLLIDLLSFIVLLFFSILIHELGHFRAAEHFGASPRLFFKKRSFEVHFDERGLSSYEKKVIYKAGVYSGLVVVFVGLFTVPFLFPALLIIYLHGCRYDIKKIKSL